MNVGNFKVNSFVLGFFEIYMYLSGNMEIYNILFLL